MDKPINKTVSIGVTAVVVSNQLLPKQRKEIILTNTSTGTEVISLAFGQDAVNGEGIVLYPGGSYASSKDGDFYPSELHVSAVSDTASSSLAISERIGQ